MSFFPFSFSFFGKSFLFLLQLFLVWFLWLISQQHGFLSPSFKINPFVALSFLFIYLSIYLFLRWGCSMYPKLVWNNSNLIFSFQGVQFQMSLTNLVFHLRKKLPFNYSNQPNQIAFGITNTMFTILPHNLPLAPSMFTVFVCGLILITGCFCFSQLPSLIPA